MPNAPRDANFRPAIICASNADGTTIVPIIANASSHYLNVEDNASGTDHGNNSGSATMDENGVSVWAAEASDGSGNIVEVYGDPVTGSVLVNSN